MNKPFHIYTTEELQEKLLQEAEKCRKKGDLEKAKKLTDAANADAEQALLAWLENMDEYTPENVFEQRRNHRELAKFKSCFGDDD